MASSLRLRRVVMSRTRSHLILNPVAGGGRAGLRRERVLSGPLASGATLHLTRRPGHATELVRRCAEAGADLVIAAGGDGTIQEVVNGLFDDGIALDPACRLGIVDCGSGSGFARSLGTTNGRGLRIDLGRVACRDRDGESIERLFVSECQIGVGGEVVRRVRPALKRVGGLVAFGLAALSQALRCRSAPLSIQIDDGPPIAGPSLGATVGNGVFCAGGMRLTPKALLDDGELDLLHFPEMSLPARLATFLSIYRGRGPGCRRGRRFRFESASEMRVAADGELLGFTPCEIRVLPAAIEVLAGKGAHPWAG